jgi:hypothetical protein
MKLHLKYLLSIVLLLFIPGGSKAAQSSAFGNPGIIKATTQNEGNNNSPELLHIQNSDLRTVNHEEKIETVRIPLPSNNQVISHSNIFIRSICSYRNRMISLMALSKTYFSKISNISPLADILRI